MLSLFLKCLLGALAVLIIAFLSRSKNFFVACLVPLFPTFALIAHYIVGRKRLMRSISYRIDSARTWPMPGVLRNNDKANGSWPWAVCSI